MKADLFDGYSKELAKTVKAVRDIANHVDSLEAMLPEGNDELMPGFLSSNSKDDEDDNVDSSEDDGESLDIRFKALMIKER